VKIRYNSIGVIHSPFRRLEGMPIQPAGAAGVKGRVVVRPAYRAGLKDLAGFSHVILLYHFHRSGKPVLTVRPFLDARPRAARIGWLKKKGKGARTKRSDARFSSR